MTLAPPRHPRPGTGIVGLAFGAGTAQPTYVGTQDLPTTGTVEVSYKIKGGDEPLTNTFTVADGEASYDSEEYIGTRSSSSKLTAVVTEVEYSEW